MSTSTVPAAAVVEYLDRAAAGGAVSPSPEVDALWHAFILDTRVYAAWCEERYGRFIHHVPDVATADGYADCVLQVAGCSGAL